MSAFSEQEPTSPQDLLHYAPRRRGERSGPRLRTVTSSADETDFDRSSSPFATSASVDAELEDAIGETLRRHLAPQHLAPQHLAPQVVPEPASFVQEQSGGNKFLMVGGGIAFAVGVAAVAALLLVKVMPVSLERGMDSPFAAAAQSGLPSATAKPAALISGGGDQAVVTREQSQQLLERFTQWRQKADAAQHQ